MSYRLWVSDDRTVLVRLWEDGFKLEVATRQHPSDTWGPPVELAEEQVPVARRQDYDTTGERRYESWLESLKDHGP